MYFSNVQPTQRFSRVALLNLTKITREYVSVAKRTAVFSAVNKWDAKCAVGLFHAQALVILKDVYR